MDLNLPGRDGLEAIRRIRQSPVSTEIPIISFSADAFKEQQLLAQEAGANDTLIKPLNTQILYSILNKYLKQSECGISDKNEPLTLPPSLETEICLKLQDIAQFQPYQSVQMVHLAEEILDLCHDYETHYLQAAEEIRNLVYSNQARRIPGYIEEILQN